MRWRRVILIALIVILLIGGYNFAMLVTTSAKVLNYGAAFDRLHGHISRRTIAIGSIPADVYRTAESRFPILLIHGVNETGKDSPDVIRIAEAFAGAGFEVVVPEFVRLTRQNVTPADIDDVVLAYLSLGRDGGMICASYGCGPALVAASRPEIRDSVRFAVAFGSYFNLTETLRFIITSPPTRFAYSKWRYMAANADLISDEHDRDRILKIAAERQSAPPEEWVLTGEDLGSDARAMLALYESSTDTEFDARLNAAPFVRNRTEQLSPSNFFDGMRARLVIVHMEADPCISSAESVKMAEAAKALGIPYTLTIFKMYGHTRPEWPEIGVRSGFAVYLPEMMRFLRVMNGILNVL